MRARASFVLLAGFSLAVIDIAAIVFAFALYGALRPANQILFQAPVAAVVVWTVSIVAQMLLSNAAPGWSPEPSPLTWSAVGLIAFGAAALLFVPLHFVTQGYLTSWGNIRAIWLFQLPTNAIALSLATLVSRLVRT